MILAILFHLRIPPPILCGFAHSLALSHSLLQPRHLRKRRLTFTPRIPRNVVESAGDVLQFEPQQIFTQH